MREVLSDEIIEANCAIYKPYHENILLNDLNYIQSQRFSKGSKMSMFLRTKSGSRPESILAQAASMSGIKNTAIAEDLAQRLRYVNERSESMADVEHVLQSLVADALNTQAEAQVAVVRENSRGVPLDQATQTIEQGLQAQEITDAELSQELAYAEENAKDDDSVSTSSSIQYNELMDAFRAMNRNDLLNYYARVRQPDSLPASYFRRGGYTRNDIITGIMENQEGIQAQDLINHMSLMNNANALREGLIHEHSHPIRTHEERESAREASTTEYETAEEQMEEAQTSRARTAAARFEERYHIPEWLNAFTHTASDMLRGERRTEGIARRAGTTREGEEL